jgi:hypothetical protein
MMRVRMGQTLNPLLRAVRGIFPLSFSLTRSPSFASSTLESGHGAEASSCLPQAGREGGGQPESYKVPVVVARRLSARRRRESTQRTAACAAERAARRYHSAENTDEAEEEGELQVAQEEVSCDDAPESKSMRMRPCKDFTMHRSTFIMTTELLLGGFPFCCVTSTYALVGLTHKRLK